MKILVVDDQFVSRQKAQKILSQYGDCDAASSGAEAIEAFKVSHDAGLPYDLIVMDILMPEVDGIETVRQIRDWEESIGIPFGRGVKILMVTATGSSNVFDSFEAGCQGYIVKPFTKEKLVKAINTAGFDLKDVFE